MAEFPTVQAANQTSREVATACRHCKTPLLLSRWDRLNGFAVRCPSCHGVHGREWNMRVIAMMSLLINAFSFFFTMRPARAFGAMVIWIGAFLVASSRFQSWPDAAQVAFFIFFLLGPLVINGFLLVRHQVSIDRHPVNARVA